MNKYFLYAIPACLFITALAPIHSSADGTVPKAKSSGVSVPKSFVYRCADGTSILASYPADDASKMTLIANRNTYQLDAVTSASGAKYEGGGITFVENQGEATVTLAPDKTIVCHVSR